jgi:hypothetical protein
MKQKLTFLLLLLTTQVISQDYRQFRLGLMSGGYGNHSEFSGGMSNAPSEFSHDSYGTGSFDFTLRYERSQRWAFMTGIGFTSAGFNFSLANDYSLDDACGDRYDMMESSIPVAQVPFMVLVKSNNNCKNWRWIAGAGIVNSFVGETTYDNTVIFSQEPEQNAEYMTVSTQSDGGYHVQSRFLIGREKQFTRGAILSFMLLMNHGCSTIGEASVTYNQDNRVYNHEFTNSGTYCGFSIAYSFRPLKGKPVSTKSIEALPLKAL